MLKRVILLALFAVALSSNPVFAFSIGSLSPNDQMTIQQAIGRTASLNFPLVREQSEIALQSAPASKADSAVRRARSFLGLSPVQRYNTLLTVAMCLRYSLSDPAQRQAFMRGVWEIGSPEDAQFARQTIAGTQALVASQVRNNQIQSGMISQFSDHMRGLQEQQFCITGQLPCPWGSVSSGEGLFESRQGVSDALGG
jgi:hypothetical protein